MMSVPIVLIIVGIILILASTCFMAKNFADAADNFSRLEIPNIFSKWLILAQASGMLGIITTVVGGLWLIFKIFSRIE